ncbi:MAG: DUF2461 domain-containing protein [bacterium]|nr:DUF2461 domain-containing protein [bacterium]
MEFLVELGMNNDREWFGANKERYEAQVREPARAFIRAVAPRLTEISEHFVASDKKVGGSLMRVHRDVRFSKDKAPYKTNVGIHFRHALGKDAHAPGFYVHIAAEGNFIGTGMWRPESSALAAIRRRIVEEEDAWRQATRSSAFTERFALGGESLKRPPKGFDADHPLVDDLKRKDHIAIAPLSDEEMLGEGVVDRILELFERAVPYLQFQCAALAVPF